MKDKELLDFAARAQGWFDYPMDSIERGSKWHTDPARAPFDHCFFKEDWNPLKDDGELYRLGIALQLFGSTQLKKWVSSYILSGFTYADAYRYGIVRAAADIGKERNETAVLQSPAV